MRVAIITLIAVAVNRAVADMPALERMAGLAAKTYIMEKKVVRPALTSTNDDVLC
jgi:hypothetical protein